MYPFGLNHIGAAKSNLGGYFNYKYNGKELQESGMYDYGARMYMPDLGRWGVVDAFSEKMRRFSPYNYAFNNPASFIDHDGNAPYNPRDIYGEHSAFNGDYDPNSTLSGSNGMGSAGNYFANSTGGGVNAGGETYYGQEAYNVLQSYLNPQSNFDQFDFIKYGAEGPGPKYTTQHYALIQGLSTFANKLFGTPFTLNKLTEDEKQNIFKQSAQKTTAILMYEYASGTGPEHRNFFPSDALTEDIKWSNSSARATTEFANQYNSGKIKDGDIFQHYVATSPDKIGKSQSIDAHFKGLADQSFWRGGMVYYMQKRGDKLYVNVFYKYTVSSGISRNDADSFNRGKAITPLGTTTINIHFNYQWINTK